MPWLSVPDDLCELPVEILCTSIPQCSFRGSSTLDGSPSDKYSEPWLQQPRQGMSQRAWIGSKGTRAADSLVLLRGLNKPVSQPLSNMPTSVSLKRRDTTKCLVQGRLIPTKHSIILHTVPVRTEDLKTEPIGTMCPLTLAKCFNQSVYYSHKTSIDKSRQNKSFKLQLEHI